ncbi:MAG: response regulator, partial [bacterium]
MDLADSALPLNDPRSASAVLVVEDEAVIAMEIESRLKVMGYRVVGCAASSQEALAIVARDRPDVILMDINIQGGRDGVEVANEMRRDHGIPSIFLTAYGDDATIRRAAESNPLSFLTKPFSDREVRAAIESLIEPTANELLDAIKGQEELDMIAAFSRPFPFRVITRLLGIPL